MNWSKDRGQKNWIDKNGLYNYLNVRICGIGLFLVPSSVTRLGYFCKILATKFLTKVVWKLTNCMGHYEKRHFLKGKLLKPLFDWLIHFWKLFNPLFRWLIHFWKLINPLFGWLIHFWKLINPLFRWLINFWNWLIHFFGWLINLWKLINPLFRWLIYF